MSKKHELKRGAASDFKICKDAFTIMYVTSDGTAQHSHPRMPASLRRSIHASSTR